MTNEKAIELLHRLQDEQFDGPHGDERREALSMAVRALEGDGDTISRKQAIDALNKHIDTFDAIDTNYLCGLRTAMSILKEMPSAQPVNYGSTKSDSSSQLKLNNDLISRQDVLKILSSKNAAWDAYDKVKRLPSAQPERKKGKWIFHETENDRYDDMICPFCKMTYTVDAYRIDDIGFTAEDFVFCPNCGARMDG